MVLPSPVWLALSYFTYFFCYGIFLPFFATWLKGEGLDAESIGLLLGAGMVARFSGTLLLAPAVKDPSRLVAALRLMAFLALVGCTAFWFGNHWAWLLMVMAGFNLFFGPLVPMSDALAATWQRQIGLDYGRVRVWGSLAFVIGSAFIGKMIAVYGHPAILVALTAGLAAMLVGMLLRPAVMPHGATRGESGAIPWRELLGQPAVRRFLLCVTLMQGAHAAYYSFSALYWQEAGYSAAVVGYLWSLGVVAEVVIFTFSQKLFKRWSARQLLLLSACCGVVRWLLMGAFIDLPWLLVMQILHCGSFTVCHLAAMRFISARGEREVIRLQAAYSALAMGGGIAVMTMISGFLFQHLHQHLFWVMALVALPAIFLRPQVAPTAR
ncbi:3-phenylpropionate MFS transporter [Nissabacter sp. SGAir0207]|uniref:3-phenylpropionate MFS transporter n=1 Tax=Nissabacter sp. SGAir0207 TaxID=2126321 RepID=UPI0010CD6590|nr:3-phenylpropionate MFS transporter [Nissabacter sp. SGAir0207]QCR35279.1 3-phenylpropionate MFS transporter [Nissabacter sp. SGAir0207]